MHRGTLIHEGCVNTSVFLYKYMKYENELKHEYEHEKQYVMNTEGDKDRL